MQDVQFDQQQPCRRNRDVSYATQHDLEYVLDLMAGEVK
jgi:hypothetical protein